MSNIVNPCTNQFVTPQVQNPQRQSVRQCACNGHSSLALNVAAGCVYLSQSGAALYQLTRNSKSSAVLGLTYHSSVTSQEARCMYGVPVQETSLRCCQSYFLLEASTEYSTDVNKMEWKIVS